MSSGGNSGYTNKDVLAYIRAQKESETSASKGELELAEQLKRDKFQHGAGKVKSRVQKEREAEEKKRKQAEQDAAKAYDEFVAAMGADEDQDSSKRARGQPTRSKPMGFVAAGGGAYVGSRSEPVKPIEPPPEQQSEATQPSSSEKASLKRVNAAFGDDSSGDEASASNSHPPPTRQEPQRKRQAMSSFLTELQSEQAQRESRLSDLASTTNKSISTLLANETLAKPGSRDLASDPLTTNICIVTLPLNVDERSVGDFFRAWGDIATVKIMWPRGEQRERATGLTGFVAFMTRAEAEQAFKEADGATWAGVRLKLSWGKAMPLPSRAMYPRSTDHKREEKQSGDSRDSGRGASKSNAPKLIIRHRRSGAGVDEQRQHIRDKVRQDCPEMQRLFIETVASRIRSNGAHFEHILREREADNPKFAFLFEQDSVLHHYFRLCLDEHYLPVALDNDEEQDFDDAGSDALYSTDSGEESETNRISLNRSTTSHTPLSPLARRRLCAMLRSLTLRRERIARITAFAMDHASSYPTVVRLLATSLLQPSTPIPRKLARLYALSDILHNSGSPISNAWRYRAALEAQLPLVFAHLGQVAASFAGRMKREEFRGKVIGVLEVWEGWIVVGPHVLERLRRLFDRPPMVKSAVEEEDLDGEALDPAQPAQSNSIEEEDLDGEAL
uniref:Uncharacterized protein n=1 Tax=Kalmanozyma brasiliensis (strain GHG001) TaxID=1365824 RepID=V5GLQ8_KALBG